MIARKVALCTRRRRLTAEAQVDEVDEEEGVLRRKERQGGRSVEEEGATRRKERRGGGSDKEERATRRGKMKS